MKKGLKILKWVVLGTLAMLVFVWVTMSLWNWLVPDLFNGPAISFWQALGLLVLSKILFSGFGGKRGGHHGGMHWRHYYRDKLAGMTPDERERFKARVREKWCHPSADVPKQQNASNV